MIGRTNTGVAFGKSALIVQTKRGAVVTVSKGTQTRKTAERYGIWVFPGLDAGDWTVRAEKDGIASTKTVTMDGTSPLTLVLYFNQIPTFTYTGDWEAVNDDDDLITETTGNWKVRFLTSGVLKFTELRGAENGIDVFAVGGGGGGGLASYAGGGGGGFCKTVKNVSVSTDIEYIITIGAGGAQNADGGSTTAFGSSVSGGYKGNTNGTGGNGGSGGGGNGYGTGTMFAGAGGSDGGNGETGKETEAGGLTKAGGTGQGTTTREFGTGALYAGGGGGASRAKNSTGGQGGQGGGGQGGGGKDNDGSDIPGENGMTNTGGGGGGISNWQNSGRIGTNGGSGIVVIRNAREVA